MRENPSTCVFSCIRRLYTLLAQMSHTLPEHASCCCWDSDVRPRREAGVLRIDVLIPPYSVEEVTVNNHTRGEILWSTCRMGWHSTQRVRRCVRTQWGDTPHKLCPPSRHEILTHTKFHPESYYFCVGLRSGCLMLMTGSRQKVRVPRWCVFWVITEPFHT